MPSNDLAIVVLVIAAFCLFGCVLGWASWDEARRKARRKS
jgi:hypothetical protein